MAHNVSALVNMVESLASELAESIQNNDTKTEQLKFVIDDQHDKDRERVRRRFNQLLTECFSSYPGNPNNDSNFKISDKLKPPHKDDNKFTLLLLGTKFKEMKEQEEALKLELNDLTFNDSETNDDPSFISLARKHKLIKYYYLSNSWEHVPLEASTLSINYALQLKFNWFGHGRDHDGIFEKDNVVDSELTVKTASFGLRNRIRELMTERRNETAKAEVEGNFSFVELLSLDQEDEFITLCTIQADIIQIGKCLCCHLCDLMFVVTQNLLLYGKWTILKRVLQLLMQNQQKHTSVIKRIVYVIERAERELRNIRKHFDGVSDNDDDDLSDDDDEKKIDQAFDKILREILCLESILSYPSLSLSKLNIKKELRAVMNGVEECKKQVVKIRSEVGDLEKRFPSHEAAVVKELKQKYQTVLRILTGTQWINLNGEP